MKNQVEQQSRLKQRLVGAIVLVALGVIFIPMILDGEREQGFIVNGSSIPAKPAEIENIRQIEFETDDVSSESDSVADKLRTGQNEIRIPVDERSAPLTPLKKKPVAANKVNISKSETPGQERPASSPDSKKIKASAAPTTQAWAVQVGSFKQKSNALKLRDKLRTQKYRAFVEALRSHEMLIYRVRLGPYVKREGAVQIHDKLLAQQKMKGLVLKHP